MLVAGDLSGRFAGFWGQRSKEDTFTDQIRRVGIFFWVYPGKNRMIPTPLL